MSLSVDNTLSTTIDCHFIVSIDTEQEPKLTSNTKPDTTACLGAWYTWDRILQTSLEGKVLGRFIIFYMLKNEVGSGEFQIGFAKLLARSDDSKFLNHVSHCCFQTSFRETARLFCLRTSKRSFELAFQCHQFEVNHHPVADVRPVLLKSGQSSLRGEAVEEMKDCRSMLQHWCRSKVMPEYGLSIFYDR
ncbi:hypothetical protein DY000_02039759 [Brassica cretica]|uniref:Uncharacterized protein n=1 Tax=Brassica cretica TaxID=69181 RepID=A0ABQ7BGX1_BRACR|nr:hypothetical protein DY000_02039759 [Brassica cretica]